MYFAICYLLSVLLLLFIVTTVLFKPSFFKRFIIFYFKMFNIDYYTYDNEFNIPFLYVFLIVIILLPFIGIPLYLVILFFQRINKILENND